MLGLRPGVAKMKAMDRFRAFESLVANIFRAEGFGVAENVVLRRGPDRYEADLVLTSKTEATAVVEVKLFRTLSLPTDALLKAALQVEYLRRGLQRDRAVIVTSSRIPIPTQRALISDNPRLTIYDYDSLRDLAAKHPELARRLEELLRETLIRPDILPATSLEPSTEILTTHADNISVATIVDEGPTASGALLCQKLVEVKSGREHARKFERAIEAALKYIFTTDLVSWSSQEITDTGMSRYDLIARVASEDDVWRMIKERFHSQYVIFECKNYKDPIRQGEIYTTEKYLYQKALRSVAFIISRTAAHQSAMAAARGALREHGKLIVSLSVDDVCKLLALKDATQDYNGFLFDKIDNMLMKLER
jgi:hypothetical protein